MFFTFVLSCMIAGSLACSDEPCKDSDLRDEFQEVGFLPNKEQLRSICPKMKAFLECEKNSMECSRLSPEELEISSKRILVAIDLVRDVCDEDSALHNDYVASVSCFREYVNGGARNCRKDISGPVEGFFDELHAGETDRNEEQANELQCLNDMFYIICLLDDIDDVCGEVAKRVATNALGRMKGMMVSGSCDELTNTAELKSKFLDFLELSERTRDEVQGIFDLFKRRR